MRYSLFIFVILSFCTYNELTPIPICESDTPSFYTCVKPIMDNHCLECHSDASPNGDLSDYDNIRYHVINGDLLDRIQRGEGAAGFMPMPSGDNKKLDNVQIETLIKWKNNGAPNN